MKKILTLLLITTTLHSFGQKKDKFKISFLLQPELTIHQNQYSSIVSDKYKKATFNLGISSAIQYSLTNRLFVDLGFGYIERKLNTSAVFNQASLPFPHTSLSKELNHTKSVTYKTFQIPINIGYTITENTKFKSFMLLGVTTNYLLTTKYNIGSTRYEYTYKKGYLQGFSLNCGFGTDFKLTKNTSLTNSFTYSIINTSRKDDFLILKSDEGAISLPHNYLRLSVGIKTKL